MDDFYFTMLTSTFIVLFYAYLFYQSKDIIKTKCVKSHLASLLLADIICIFEYFDSTSTGNLNIFSAITPSLCLLIFYFASVYRDLIRENHRLQMELEKKS